MGHKHSRRHHHDDGSAARAAAATHAAAQAAERERVAAEAARAKAEADERARKAAAEAHERAMREERERKAAAQEATRRENERIAAIRAAEEAERRRVAERAAAERARLVAAGLSELSRASGQKHIAVCGPTGVGKSSLINRIQLHAGGEARAEVGAGREVTAKSTPHRHPIADRLTMWDIPGGDTDAHPAATYFTDHCLDMFDGLVICFTGRATQLCCALVAEAQRRGIPFATVFTKADQALAAVAHDNGLEEPDMTAPAGPAMERLRAEVASTASSNGWATTPLIVGRLQAGGGDAASDARRRRGTITVDGDALLAWLSARSGVPLASLTA